MTANMRTVSVAEQKALISDDAVRQSFLARPDIAALPQEDQERRWQAHLVGLEQFREWLSGLDSIVVERGC